MNPVAIVADSFSTTPPSPSLKIPASSTLPCRGLCRRPSNHPLCISLRQRTSKRAKSHLDWIVVRRERSICSLLRSPPFRLTTTSVWNSTCCVSCTRTSLRRRLFHLSVCFDASSLDPNKLEEDVRLKLIPEIYNIVGSFNFALHDHGAFKEAYAVSEKGRSWGSMGDIHNGNHGGFHGYDSDVECPSPPDDVPAGCLAVYVGKEQRRFVIPTSYLSNSVFRALLAKSEEEFGFCCDGGLRIACAPDVFEHLLWWLEGANSEFEETVVVGHAVGSL